jgi:3-methyladenine DNA glycosylase AlkC
MTKAHRCNWRCYPGYCIDPYPERTTVTTETHQGRHPATTAIMRHFAYGHLPEHLARVSAECAALAHRMADELNDDPELTAGLRKLLEAKDCFARAAVIQHDSTTKGSQ